MNPKMSITRYGMPQVIIVPGIIIALGGLLFWLWPGGQPWVQMPIGILFVFSLAFFRDPQRAIPSDKNVLLSPADGKITDIIELEEAEFIKEPAIRIGIFLSVFDVHINRAPCDGIVAYIREQPGKCLNALNSEEASLHNQATIMGMDCPEGPAKKIIIKQITGAIARRIVCAVNIGDKLTGGYKYGMIKFGSRTELYLPKDQNAKIMVEKGQTVRAGTTIMVSYDA